MQVLFFSHTQRERERERENMWIFSFLSVNHIFFSRNSEKRQVVDTALIIACFYVKFYTKFMFLIVWSCYLLRCPDRRTARHIITTKNRKDVGWMSWIPITLGYLQNWLSCCSVEGSFQHLEREKTIIFFLFFFIIQWSLFVKPSVPFT